MLVRAHVKVGFQFRPAAAAGPDVALGQLLHFEFLAGPDADDSEAAADYRNAELLASSPRPPTPGLWWAWMAIRVVDSDSDCRRRGRQDARAPGGRPLGRSAWMANSGVSGPRHCAWSRLGVRVVDSDSDCRRRGRRDARAHGGRPLGRSAWMANSGEAGPRHCSRCRIGRRPNTANLRGARSANQQLRERGGF